MAEKPKKDHFIKGSDQTKVKADNVLRDGDWILKWNPDESDTNHSGFTMYTPMDFDPKTHSGPLGGLILAAFYFLLEHGHDGFYKEIIARANALSATMMEEDRENQDDTKPTLN